MNFPCNMILNIQTPPFYLDNNGLLYKGDCLNILGKMPNNSIDFILTDPPYGINFTNSRRNKIKNDSRVDAIDIFEQFIIKSARILKPGGCCCVFCFSGGRKPLFPIWIQIMQEHLEYKSTVVWDKQIIGLGSHYRHIYDFILIGKKTGNKCKWNGGKNKSNIVHERKVIPKSSAHPTPKPVELMKYFIKLHSNADDIILDPFAGCGPTLQAAIELNRKYIGIEIENRYCRNIANNFRKLSSI
ncbi:MAG: site-specific DNA-methyltransferase [candidate division Zixibacteria bacterium]|nr:site-specific DNA-methyltransferase [candidate division Zixibacteria bacterium]